jgi:serine/threonine protein kinase
MKAILGRGGMGIVWRAFDEHLERDVALKFLPELIVLDHAALDELKRETKRNLELTHHNIVRIYDFAHEDNTACISMEYVDGATLSALRVEREAKIFKVAELQPLVAQFCHALEYAHIRARIVHRDLKPANLIVNASAQLKITDFGIARSLSDSVSMLSMKATSGTLLYMSPQQLDGDRPSSLDDIYSIGATLYELLTSKPPFFSGEIETQIREKEPAPIAARRKELNIGNGDVVPDDWEQTIVACLSKDSAQRPQSAGELAARLGLAPRPIESAPITDNSVDGAKRNDRRQQPYRHRRPGADLVDPNSAPGPPAVSGATPGCLGSRGAGRNWFRGLGRGGSENCEGLDRGKVQPRTDGGMGAHRSAGKNDGSIRQRDVAAFRTEGGSDRAEKHGSGACDRERFSDHARRLV